MLGRGLPTSVWSVEDMVDIPYLTSYCGGYNTPFTNKAVQINDHELDDTAREARLKTLFKAEGIRLRFKGSYPHEA